MRGIKRPMLELTPDERRTLEQVSRSRTVSVAKQERARVMLASADGMGVVRLARELQMDQSKVMSCLERGRALMPVEPLEDRPAGGRKGPIPP